MSKYIAIDRKGNYRLFNEMPMRATEYDGSAKIHEWLQTSYPCSGEIIDKERAEQLLGKSLTYFDDPLELVNYDNP